MTISACTNDGSRQLRSRQQMTRRLQELCPQQPVDQANDRPRRQPEWQWQLRLYGLVAEPADNTGVDQKPKMGKGVDLKFEFMTILSNEFVLRILKICRYIKNHPTTEATLEKAGVKNCLFNNP